MNTTVVIRQRGQITIPDQIRNFLKWLSPNSVVSITVANNEEVIIRPLLKTDKQKPDWKKIWEGLELVNSFKGKRGSLSDFIIKDRENH